MRSIFCVPTYDIDLMWHSHQLKPVAYAQDTMTLLPKVLEHDDIDSDRSQGQKQDTGFHMTCELWENMYGVKYERAGVLYKGEPPSPLPPLEKTTSHSMSQGVPFSFSLPHQDIYLTQRKVLQVYLVIYGAKGLPTKKVSCFEVRISTIQEPKKFMLKARPLSYSPNPLWNKVLTMECEASTGGLIVGLQSRSSGIFGRKKLIGCIPITWEKLLDVPGLALDQWFHLSKDLIEAKLHIGMSVTPPIAAPYLFRARKTRHIGDDLRTLRTRTTNRGLWMTRTIIQKKKFL
ncbi:hypothetical protein O6H91_02G025000 [Diphasiastrum complanatum]|uniref:Uncharacterized protein n=1 Tax=Diphasiastrum complanatum TaxID=34168 RepID=A0ACC2EDP2_DIPCM|nr:hypothetical protein O6H91_02G025000 [Diphasiastrum complanatum]